MLALAVVLYLFVVMSMALRCCVPIRCFSYVDNDQFAFGHALKPEATSFFESVLDNIKTFYVTSVSLINHLC